MTTIVADSGYFFVLFFGKKEKKKKSVSNVLSFLSEEDQQINMCSS